MTPPTALVLEDDRASREALARVTESEGFRPILAGSIAEARVALERETPDILLLDLDLPDGSGLEVLEELKERPDVDVVLVSGTATIDDAVLAMREGAVDVLTKPVDAKRLRGNLVAARRTAGLRSEVDRLRGELKSLGRFGGLVGKSPACERLYDQIGKVAPTSSSVLITGETGTGKEVVARTIHELGPRARRELVAINCGAVASELIESELFGHERGSFTGATKTRRGVFELADGGTLFLDEITEMSPALQVRLLRVLETGEITRVGGERPLSVDVRILAATNQAPEEAVRSGSLREDLFFRLNVFPIEIPPLRERTGDCELLARHFLDELARTDGRRAPRLSPQAVQELEAHDWPGNVRELRNAIERAFVTGGDEIRPEHLGLQSSGLSRTEENGLGIRVGQSIAEAERRLILATLDDHGGDKKRCAATLGISLKTLYNRLNRYAQES